MTTDTKTGWRRVETIDMTGACYSQAKPEIERLVEKYQSQGHRVKIESRALIDVLIASDA